VKHNQENTSSSSINDRVVDDASFNIILTSFKKQMLFSVTLGVVDELEP